MEKQELIDAPRYHPGDPVCPRPYRHCCRCNVSWVVRKCRDFGSIKREDGDDGREVDIDRNMYIL